MTSHREISLLRLVAQRVAGPPWSTPEQAVGWLTAVQAQDLPGAITSIALRTASRSRDDVVAAFDDGRIARTWPMRGTLHAVRTEDLPWMVGLMAPRPMAAAAKRRVQLGLADADLVRAQEVATAALADGGALTRAEILAAWEQASLPTKGGLGYHMLSHLGHANVVCLGPMRGTEQAFVLVEEWVREPRQLERDEALAELALRYLRSHGPATVKDLIRWTGLPAADVRAGVAAAADELDVLEVDGTTYHLDPQTPELLEAHRDAATATHLLPGFDEIVLGYADRTATVPAEHADRIVPGGNGVFRPTVVDGGLAVGTWAAVGTGRNRRVEVQPFAEPDPDLLAVVEERFAAEPIS